MKHKFFLVSGYTGHLLEEEVLGSCKVSWSGYMSFKAAKELARNHQPKILCPCAERFKNAVARELNVDPLQVRLFTAVGSPLDEIHSVDGWFEFNGLTVTFDVTMKLTKTRYRSDVVVYLQNGDDDMTSAARDIAAAFKWAGGHHAIHH